MARLTELRAAGRPNREVADALGRTVSGVEKWIRKSGVTRQRSVREWSRADDDTAESMAMAGKSSAEIAAVLGRTVHAVWDRMSRLEIRSVRAGHMAWREALWDGRPTAEVAKKLGVTRGAVYSARWRLRTAGFDIPRPMEE